MASPFALFLCPQTMHICAYHLCESLHHSCSSALCPGILTPVSFHHHKSTVNSSHSTLQTLTKEKENFTF
jgi:hypothetical protein